MFTSKTTRGFYDPTIHLSMPKDVVEISAERYAELMAGQRRGEPGLVLDLDVDQTARPFLVASAS